VEDVDVSQDGCQATAIFVVEAADDVHQV